MSGRKNLKRKEPDKPDPNQKLILSWVKDKSIESQVKKIKSIQQHQQQLQQYEQELTKLNKQFADELEANDQFTLDEEALLNKLIQLQSSSDYYWALDHPNSSAAKLYASNLEKMKRKISAISKKRYNSSKRIKYLKARRAALRRLRKSSIWVIRSKRRRIRRRYRRGKAKVQGKKVYQNTSASSVWLYKKKKKLAQTKQIRKLFKAGDTIKRENIQNEGTAIVKNIGLNKYRYFSQQHLTITDIYKMLHHMPVHQLLDSVYSGAQKVSNSNSYYYNADPSTQSQAMFTDSIAGNTLTFDNNNQTTENLRNVYSNKVNEGMGMYLGKCTYTYDIVNPTNYTIYVDLYDLVARQDYINHDYQTTQYQKVVDNNSTNAGKDIDGTTTTNTSITYPGVPSPEACMYYGSTYLDNINSSYQSTVGGATNLPVSTSSSAPTTISSATEYRMRISQSFFDDPFGDTTNIAKWNSLGTKPTHYRFFNKLWKIKKINRIVLGPNATYKHTQVIKLGQLIDRGSFFYRFPEVVVDGYGKYDYPGIIAGVTTCLLLRAVGQLASERNITESVAVSSNTGKYLMGNDVFHLPAKLLIRDTKVENIYYGRYQYPIYKTVTDLLKNDADLSKVRVMTNLEEKLAEDTTDKKDNGT